jgi:hypothetical protein
MEKHMMTNRIALLAAGTLIASACQTQPDHADVTAASEQVSLSDITHVPLGNAVLIQQGEQLLATNMHTLADGVRSLYQPSVHWQADLLWASNVTAMRMNSINSRLSGEDTTSSLSMDRVGANAWTARATFVAPSYRVNVYSGGVLKGTITHDPNQTLTFQFNAVYPYVGSRRYRRHFRVRPWWLTASNSAPMQQCSWELELPSNTRVTQGGTVLVGDRVEIIEDPHESYGGFDEIQVLGNGDVTYFSEQVVTE